MNITIKSSSKILLSFCVLIFVLNLFTIFILAENETDESDIPNTVISDSDFAESEQMYPSTSVNPKSAEAYVPAEKYDPELVQYNAHNFRNSLLPGMRITAYFLVPLAILIIFTYYKLSKTINLSK